MNITNPPFPGSGSSPDNATTDAVVRPTEGGRDNPGQVRFLSDIRTAGVQRTNSFFITLAAPRVLTNQYNWDVFRKIEIYAESVNLPGVNLGTTQNRSYGIGYQQKYVNDVSFNDLTVSFINNGDMDMTVIFYDWINKIIRFDDFINGPRTESGQQPYEIEYKDNYIAPEFYIKVLDEKRVWVAEYRIFEAFPVSMSDISMNWGSNDEFARFTVNFTYSFWKVDFNTQRF